MAYALSAAALGIMLFFSIFVAPVIFKVLPAQWAGAYVRAFFPRYYLALGGISLAIVCTASQPVVRGLSLFCVISFAFLYAVLTPWINRMRDQQQSRAFDRGHALSVVLNLLQMGLLFACLLLSTG